MVIKALLTPHKNGRAKNYLPINEHMRTKKDLERCKLSI